MLKLKTLNFKNIGRFTESQEISFDKLGNLVQVHAQNNNTGGSSGSGKSTIFNGLDWLLGLNDLSTTTLQSRLTKEGIVVAGIFDWDGKEIHILRGKKLSITIDGVETAGSSKITEELLDLILGMPRKLFRSILHKRQNDQGWFLELGPAKTNDLLVDALGHAHIRSKVDMVDLKIKEYAKIKTEAESELQALQAALEATKSAILSLGQEPQTEVTEVLVEGWKQQYEGWKETLATKQSIHKQEKDSLDQKKPKLSLIGFDRTLLDELSILEKSIEKEINLVLDQEKSRQVLVNREISLQKQDLIQLTSNLKLENSKKISENKNAHLKLTHIVENGKVAREEAVKLAAQLKLLRSGVCSTCEQSWITGKAKEEDQRLLDKLSQHKVTMEAASQAANEITALELELDVGNEEYSKKLTTLNEERGKKIALLMEETKPLDLNETLIPLNEALRSTVTRKLEERAKEASHNTEQNIANRKAMDSFVMEQMALANKHKDELSVIVFEVNESRSNYERTQSELDSWKKGIERYKSSITMLKSKETETNQKLVDMNSKVVHQTDNLEMAEEIKRCLKNYLSCSFDDALESISETATRILRAVPTMSNATIRLEGTKETGAGAIKDQVNAVLDNDGELEIPIKSLSGGERSAVDLAIDLAVCEMIQEKANKGIDIMILDEPFNGFDSVGIENALEMLRTFSTDKRILLVEHDSVAKEFISDKITVIRDGETSYIK
jgi:DNA repair exonuclease SbcCD ATPase subunit